MHAVDDLQIKKLADLNGAGIPCNGYGDAFFVGVTFPDGVGERDGANVTTGTGDGDTKIILIALSSGTGDNTFLPDIRRPTMIDTKTRRPMITVIAASVRLRSSISLSIKRALCKWQILHLKKSLWIGR